MVQRLRVLVLLSVLAGVGILVASALGQWWGWSPEPAPPSALPGGQGRVRVEVLNGSGLPGVARGATRALRDQGFDVVFCGNAETFSQDSSVVMDRVGGPEAARAVAEALGIRNVRSEPDSSLLVDVTVRLGPDWGVGEEPGEDGESPAWWDLRRLFRRGGDS